MSKKKVTEEDKDLKEKGGVQRWKDRITTSLRYLATKRDEYQWEGLIDKYEGKWDIKIGDIKVPPINDIFSFVDSDISLMSAKDPYLNVNPQKGSSVKAAKMLEAWLNYQWRELGVKRSTDNEMLDTDIIGHSWHKTGYSAEVVVNGDQPQLKSEKYYSSHVPWRDVVFNIGSKNPPYDCQWMAIKITRPLEQLKKKYSQLKDVKGSVAPEIDSKEYEGINRDDISNGTLWEIHDSEDKKIYLICEGYDKFLSQKDWPDYMDEFPLDMLWYYKNPKCAYPLSPCSMWVNQVIEKTKLMAMALNHAKRWNRQIFTKPNVITEEEKQKYLLGIDGNVIETQAQNLGDDIKAFDYGQLPTDFYTIMDRIDNIIRTTSGMPEIEKGNVMKTQTRTLGELELVRAGSKGRTDRRLMCLENHFQNIGRKMLMHFLANFDGEIIFKLTDRVPQEVADAFKDHIDPNTGEVKFRSEEIKGEYAVTIRAGSTLALNEQTKLAILEKVLDLATKFPSPVPPFVKVIISELLAKFHMPQLETAFAEQDAAAAQQAAQEKSMADVEKAKVISETEKRMAQANQIDAETDDIEKMGQLDPDVKAVLEGKLKLDQGGDEDEV